MNREDIERFLERGDTLGFRKPSKNADFLGWILISKQKNHERYLNLTTKEEEPRFHEEQELIRLKPYLAHVVELNKAAYEREEYESNEDYSINIIYRFSSLDEIEEFLFGYNCKLAEIKWPIEIGAP